MAQLATAVTKLPQSFLSAPLVPEAQRREEYLDLKRQELAAGATETEVSWANYLSDSLRGQPLDYLPDPSPRLIRSLSAAILAAKEKLLRTDPKEVIAAIGIIAERKQLELPPAAILELDIDLLSEMPHDLFPRAFREVYRTFRWNKLPEVADWEAPVLEEWNTRKSRLLILQSLEARLEMKVKGTPEYKRATFAALPAPCYLNQSLLPAKPTGTVALLETRRR